MDGQYPHLEMIIQMWIGLGRKVLLIRVDFSFRFFSYDIMCS